MRVCERALILSSKNIYKLYKILNVVLTIVILAAVIFLVTSYKNKHIGYESTAKTTVVLMIVLSVVKCIDFAVGSLVINEVHENNVYEKNVHEKNNVSSDVHTEKPSSDDDNSHVGKMLMHNEIVDTAPLAYIVISDNYVVDCNAYAMETIGIRCGIKMNSYYKNVSERDVLIEYLQRGEIVDNEQVTLKMADGSCHRFAMNVSMICENDYSNYIIWGMDIENEMRKSDIIDSSQADFNMLLDALPVAVVINDIDTNEVQFANLI